MSRNKREDPAERARRRSPRALAAEVLDRVDRAGAYASILLRERGATLDDPRDVALLHELVLGTLRHRRALDATLARVAGRPVEAIDTDLRPLLRSAAYALLKLDRVPDHAAVDEAVRLVPHRRGRDRRGFVNGVLRAVARAGTALLPPAPERGDVAALALHASHPEWWTRRQVERDGWERAVAILAADNRPAPTVLHADLTEIDRAGLLALCAERGIPAEPGRFAPAAVRLGSGGRRLDLDRLPAWIQDEASQLVPLLLAPFAGRVADLCAAPGGKSLAIACRLEPDGALLAADRNPARAARLARRLERRGAGSRIEVRAEDAAALPAADERGRFDRVLVDAPCSGTGTLRRHPEIRDRLREEDLLRLAGTQGGILRAAAERVRPGGVLVYAVCSIEPEEGPGAVEAFLAGRPDFVAVDAAPLLPPEARGLVRDRFLASTPADGDLDGFFAARLERREGDPPV